MTIVGVRADDKPYDGTTAAKVHTTGAAPVGVFAGDNVQVAPSGVTGTFAQKDVADGIAVAVSGVMLVGGQAQDYAVVQPSTSANITAAQLTVTGIAAYSKVYDRATSASLKIGRNFLSTGNVLVDNEAFSSPSQVSEITPTGSVVHSIHFATPGQPRAAVMDNNGNIDVYNGTFTPTLTTLNPATGAVVANTTLAGWSTINNTTYGGLAAYGNYVFATDETTANGGDANGIVRFDINAFTAERFDNNVGDYIQITMGKDGLLYALTPSGSPGGRECDVFDPNTLARQTHLVRLPRSARYRGGCERQHLCCHYL